MTEPTDARERAIDAIKSATLAFVENPDNANLSDAEAQDALARAILDAALATGAVVDERLWRDYRDRLSVESLKRKQAEARCAELYENIDNYVSETNMLGVRLAEAEELLRELNDADFDTRNLTMENYEDRVRAFLAEEAEDENPSSG
jgi:hypothetical protein